MSLLGLRGTGDWATDERPKNFRETILWRDPNGQTPLTALMAKMRKESTDDPEFAWYEEALTVPRLQLAAALVGDTTIVPTSPAPAGFTADGTDLVAGDLLLNERTSEIMQVSGVTSAISVQVVRGAAGTTAAAINLNDAVTKIGNAYGEGTSAPSVTTRNPTKVYNLAQIFKTAYEITNTAKGTRTRTGDPLKNDKKRKMFDHAAALEMAFMHGVRFEDTDPSNGKPRRYTGGLRQFITTNVTTTFTATTPLWTEFLNAISPVFDYRSQGAGNERLLLMGNGALNGLNRMAAANTQIQAQGTIKLYGMELMKIVIPQGTFYCRTHPLLNVHPLYTNSIYCIDPSNMIYRPFRDTKSQDNIQAPDADTQKGQWLTEAGIELEHEGTFAILDNFGA